MVYVDLVAQMLNVTETPRCRQLQRHQAAQAGIANQLSEGILLIATIEIQLSAAVVLLILSFCVTVQMRFSSVSVSL